MFYTFQSTSPTQPNPNFVLNTRKNVRCRTNLIRDGARPLSILWNSPTLIAIVGQLLKNFRDQTHFYSMIYYNVKLHLNV